MISENAKYWIWLTQCLGYNNPKLNKLHELYDNIVKFVEGGEHEWRLSGVLSANDLEKLGKQPLSVSDEIISSCRSLNYSIVTLEDETYPEKLRNIYSPPAVLYMWGNTDIFDNRLVIGIVGTRTASSYGTRNAYQFGYAFAKFGVATVSGGALGVDCAGHRGSLAADGVTICVRGCGINNPYLQGNSAMRAEITRKGVVISEYPPDTEPLPFHFPARNRIIAGLCDGLLIIESGEKSGSLITADLALEMGKEVFALLGNNSPRNKGSNTRIKEGSAIPVTDFMDILAEFDNIYVTEKDIDFDGLSLADINAIPVKPSKYANKQWPPKGITKEKEPLASPEEVPIKEEKPKHRENVELTELQKKVYYYLSDEPVHIDKIASDLKIPVFKVLSALTYLEINGLVQSGRGRKFQLK